MNINKLNNNIVYQDWENIENCAKFYSVMIIHREVFSDINFINHFIHHFENYVLCWVGLIIFTKLDIQYIRKMYESKFSPYLKEILVYLTYVDNQLIKNNIATYQQINIDKTGLSNIEIFINEYSKFI